MKVYGKCKNCKNEISFSTKANTRVEFAMLDEENITLNCNDCGTNTKFHVDKLFAKDSKIAQISAGIILLIGIPLIFIFLKPIFLESRNLYVIYILSGLLIVPFTAYSIIKKQDQARVSSFNKRKLKGRTHNL